MRRYVFALAGCFALMFAGVTTEAAQPPLPALALHLGDLRKGYRIESHGYLTAATEASYLGTNPGRLRQMGWAEAYFASFRIPVCTQCDAGPKVSNSLDLFHTPRGAAWAYHQQFKVLCTDIRGIPEDVARLGDESAVCASTAVILFFQKGRYLVTVSTAETGHDLLGALSLARLLLSRVSSADR